MSYPRNYILLLFGFGVSNLGNWIYLIALNLAVWHLTHSPAAVAGLYLVGPIARILCSFFAGSIIDRSNKKQILIWTDIIRGIIVCIMPFISSIWLIYTFIFFANIASSFFGPSSTFMITKIVEEKDRKRFNAINSILSSGSFMIGPALGGAIIMMTNTSIAMWINGITFFICALALSFLPNIETSESNTRQMITFQILRSDFQHVIQFSREHKILQTFFIVFSIALTITFALDSQELTFLKDHLHVSDSIYGVVVSVAGVGAILGGAAAAIYVKKISLVSYIGAGFSITLLSYVIFYMSQSIIVAVISFVALGFFMAFCNTGYATLYQKSIPPEIMGRFGSILNLLQGILQIVFTFVLGLVAEWYSVQAMTSIFAFIALLLAIYLYIHLVKHKPYFQSGEDM
ncbi:MFS transporter [Ureibacillus acetophenoni]|uniref:Sugar phosphate permease n=1 Tax=Ureibacillus acetophenoni TaxID=614649 RepID=A0A285UN79_9BACL|nr:MFS transporter [Ureibacillus acetophenoni]SOC43233.1 sugar phosphate permease [Ureibacillus acetophenoni]